MTAPFAVFRVLPSAVQVSLPLAVLSRSLSAEGGSAIMTASSIIEVTTASSIIEGAVESVSLQLHGSWRCEPPRQLTHHGVESAGLGLGVVQIRLRPQARRAQLGSRGAPRATRVHFALLLPPVETAKGK
jgi:hypothetical protein